MLVCEPEPEQPSARTAAVPTLCSRWTASFEYTSPIFTLLCFKNGQFSGGPGDFSKWLLPSAIVFLDAAIYLFLHLFIHSSIYSD